MNYSRSEHGNESGDRGYLRHSLVQRLRHLNWPLLLGGLLVIFIFVLAVKGQDWAVHDPMKENYSLRINGQVIRPPYPPFVIEGYPLGTDQFGRDLLSRILWGIRPTMILVMIAASIRLVVGVVLGLFAGWIQGTIGRALESLLSLALSVPVLLVALMGIAALGIKEGLGAFIFGMTLTGWAETARIVREQTRILRSQVYIEAARALGASDGRIIFSHILRQIMPLATMLLTFEISATLLLTAELGFIGYYIGGGVWVEISDFVVVNTTGLPELGQLLSTALFSLVKPWVLFAVSSLIFIIILGFNLLGEGLRRRSQNIFLIGRPKNVIFRGRLGEWLEQQVFLATDWLEDRIWAIIAIAILLAGGMTGWLWFNARPEASQSVQSKPIVIPGGHLWAAGRHDSQGTLWTDAKGPRQAEILWSLIAPGGLDGGPAIDAAGNILLACRDKILFMISPDGKELWRADLPDEPVGSPALTPSEDIAVAIANGDLLLFSSEGQKIWHFSHPGREATSGPIAASNGNIYYTRVDRITAVSNRGEFLWTSEPTGIYTERPPILSAGESFIFLRDTAFAADSGIPIDVTELAASTLEFEDPTFVVGADGRTYYRKEHSLAAWRSTAEGLEIEPFLTWKYSGSVVMVPYDQGATPLGLIWFFYASDYSDSHLAWIDSEGKQLSHVRLPARAASLVAIDRDNTAYICSSNFGAVVSCLGIDIGSDEPAWEIRLNPNDSFSGGALIDGRLYVTTDSGYLFALADR